MFSFESGEKVHLHVASECIVHQMRHVWFFWRAVSSRVACANVAKDITAPFKLVVSELVSLLGKPDQEIANDWMQDL